MSFVVVVVVVWARTGVCGLERGLGAEGRQPEENNYKLTISERKTPDEET